jgi:hypothetical protein
LRLLDQTIFMIISFLGLSYAHNFKLLRLVL